MCPDPQLLSIYMDGELPSPWKEKMEIHLTKCLECRQKYENFKQLKELLKKNNRMERTYIERIVSREAAKDVTPSAEETQAAPEITIDAAKDRVWRNMRRMKPIRRFRSGAGIMRRRLSIPLPAAAAAVVVLAVLALVLLRGVFNQRFEPSARANFLLASEEEVPVIIPADMNDLTDMNRVLQYLGSDGTDVIIMRLPESRNFSRSGEPTIINAADYSRRRP